MSSNGCARPFPPTPGGAQRHRADCARRHALGPDVEIQIFVYDETNTRIRPENIAQSIAAAGPGPRLSHRRAIEPVSRAPSTSRAVFARRGAQVAIGGFHVSGCLAMLPEMPPDIARGAGPGRQPLRRRGRGPVRRRAARRLLRRRSSRSTISWTTCRRWRARRRRCCRRDRRRTTGAVTSFDAGRGCPFQCSFCTIINVQGRKSRHRSADDVEAIIRANLARASTPSSSPTTISPATATGRRSSTG